MQALRLVMLLAAVPVCYLLFFHSQQPAGKTDSAPETHSQYKREMDKAHEAAKQMQAQRNEADSM